MLELITTERNNLNILNDLTRNYLTFGLEFLTKKDLISVSYTHLCQDRRNIFKAVRLADKENGKQSEKQGECDGIERKRKKD